MGNTEKSTNKESKDCNSNLSECSSVKVYTLDVSNSIVASKPKKAVWKLNHPGEEYDNEMGKIVLNDPIPIIQGNRYQFQIMLKKAKKVKRRSRNRYKVARTLMSGKINARKPKQNTDIEAIIDQNNRPPV